MANKKRKRPTVPNRPLPVAPSTRTGADPASGAAASATAEARAQSAQNRAARKEEARRQREAIRRRQQRRKYYRVAAVVLVVLIVAGIIVGVSLAGGGGGGGGVDTTQAARAAGCGAVQTVSAYPNNQDRSHIGAQGATGSVSTPPPLSTYPSTPPASGPHDPSPLDAGVYSQPPDVYRVIHSLEHGAVVIWYSPSAPPAEVAKITSFYQSGSESDHVIVAPYDYASQGSAGSLPAGKQMVMVAWHHLQACTKLSLDAAKGFVQPFRTPTGGAAPGYKGDAPEAGLQI
jgi:Protein of unknown function (DUF3105)